MNNNLDLLSSRRIVLVQSGDRIRVTPAESANGFPSFALPHLPLSAVRQLAALGDRFWNERQACIVAVLMLDRLTRIWMPVLPTQWCRRSGARFRLWPEDYSDLPSHLVIGGSFQTRLSPGLFGAAKAVPGWHGVHLVASADNCAGGDGFVFLRLSSEAQLIDPDRVFADDLQLMLRRYAGRLRVRGPHQ